MNEHIGCYIDSKDKLVIYMREDGGGEVRVNKDDVLDVISYLLSFYYKTEIPASSFGSRDISKINSGTGIEYLNASPTTCDTA